MIDRDISPSAVESPVEAPSLKPRTYVLTGAAVSVSALLVWLILIHNRFLTIHEGWFSYYGYLMNHGKFPYRDFYFFTQPLHLLIAQAVSLFGDKLVYYRDYGLVERVVITGLLYLVLSREFSAAAAVCGTIAPSLFFLAYPTDALSSYLYTCLLFLLASIACIQQAWRSARHRELWMGLAGCAACLSFFTKQSNGLLVIVSLVFAVLMVSQTLRDAVRDVTAYSAGVVVGAGPFVGWLAANRAWDPYVNEVFRGAASSKGGMKAVLTGFIARQIHMRSIACFVLLLVAIAVLLAAKQLKLMGPDRRALQFPQPWAIAAIGAGFLLALYEVHRTGARAHRIMAASTSIIVDVSLYLLAPLLLVVLWRRFVSPGLSSMRGYEGPILLLIASVFWTWSCGMSWNVAEQSAIPSLSLFLAFAYDRIQIGRGRWMSAMVAFFSVFVIFLGMWHKWNLSFSWEGWFEQISIDGAHSHWPQLSDFSLDREEVNIYDTILDDVARYTKPGESILTFPTIPMFNFIGTHPQPTFAPVHYWDVCPDPVASRDAQRILAVRPKMIVNLELADWVWKEHDEGWRAGHRSGQRDFQDAIDTLTSSGAYRKLDTLLTPAYQMKVVVWLRER